MAVADKETAVPPPGSADTGGRVVRVIGTAVARRRERLPAGTGLVAGPVPEGSAERLRPLVDELSEAGFRPWGGPVVAGPGVPFTGGGAALWHDDRRTAAYVVALERGATLVEMVELETELEDGPVVTTTNSEWPAPLDHGPGTDFAEHPGVSVGALLDLHSARCGDRPAVDNSARDPLALAEARLAAHRAHQVAAGLLRPDGDGDYTLTWRGAWEAVGRVQRAGAG